MKYYECFTIRDEVLCVSGYPWYSSIFKEMKIFFSVIDCTTVGALSFSVSFRMTYCNLNEIIKQTIRYGNYC